MHHIYNEQTQKTLTDEYGHEIKFHNEWMAKEYYLQACTGMCNVVIKFIEKE
jgi:hypothetical protein